MNIAEIRQKYPQYEDLSDDELTQALHKKFYADMPYDEFAAKVGGPPAVDQSVLDPRDSPAASGRYPKPDPTQWQKFLASPGGGALRGGKDLWDAAAQMLSRLGGQEEAARVDQGVREGISEYEAARQAVGKEGFDVPRTVGSVVLPAVLSGGAGIPAAGASLLARAGLGAATGAAYGALQPVTEGDFWSEKGKQTALGAATGAVAAPLTEAVARVVRPKVSEGVQALRNAGVFPTLGQAKGGMFKTIEEKMASVPLVGDAIVAGQRGANEQLNRAAWNRALSPLGKSLPKNLKGQDAVAFVDDQIDDAYRAVIDKIGAKPVDTKLMQDLYGLRDLLANVSQDAKSSFGNFIKTQVNDRLQNGRYLTGEQIKGLEEQLGRYARDMARSNTAGERQLGQAYREAQASMREWLARAAPEQAKSLKAVNSAYANFLRPLRASGYLGVQDETFTAAQLQNAVRALDPSKHKKAFARGDALMQDLSGPAKDVLTARVPNSGTTDRALLAYLLANPVKGVGAAAASIPMSAMYSAPGRQAAALLGSRPDFAQPLSEVIRRSVPFTGAGLYGLLGQE